MFKYVLLFALVGIAIAGESSSSDDVHAETKLSESDVRADGFDWSLETSNGISAQSSGDEHGNMHGGWSYISKDGVPVKVTYVADENGFQPSSDLLPTPPPTPEAILKALAWLDAHPHQEDKKHLKVLRRWFKEYDFKAFRLYGGPQHYIVMPNAKNMESVLSSTTLLYKHDLYYFMRPWLGQGLLTSNGQYWATHRKIITPSFHFTILQDFLHIINSTTDRFMNMLDTYAQTGKKFDIQEVVSHSTLDVICECAMGYNLNSIELGKSPMVQAINDLSYVIEHRAFSVFKRPDFLFKLTSDYRMQQRALKILKDKFSEIINSRRKILAEIDNNKVKNDSDCKRTKMAFLDNLLTARIDGQSLTYQEIFEEVSTFMFEGHDTTASALTFTIYCLSRHPQVQQKAFEEQLSMFGSDIARWPTYTELLDMKYLELVIKESLRLYPSVPIILRTVPELTEIDGLTLPAKTTLLLPIIGLGSDERNFPEPYKFQPERFELDSRTQANPFDYVPFSAGPRNCVGQKFAMMELKCTLSKILRHFVILPAVDGLGPGIHDPCKPRDISATPYDVRLAMPLTLKSANGVIIRMKKRMY